MGELEWENVERLFMRMLASVGEVQWAKLYGTRGQDQEGIDAYARMQTTGSSDSTGRPYVVLQSRRVKKLGAADIDAAIADFLDGTWPTETSKYILATSYDLTDTKLDAAVRRAAKALGARKIEFEPWGAVEISNRLKRQPELVDDFFGRAWVEPFCGPEGLQRVQRRLEWFDAQSLREKLSAHYLAIFAAQNAVPRPTLHTTGSFGGATSRPAPPSNDFIVVDVTPRIVTVSPRDEGLLSGKGDRADANVPTTAIPYTSGPEPADIAATRKGETRAQTGLGRPRRSFRAVEALLGENRISSGDNSFRQAADDWLTSSRRALLVGAPGSGKSSLLRFVAVDVLSLVPQSTVLQQAYGGRLPVWLPFGFLTRHLADEDGNSLVSAAQAWMQARGMSETWPLVERALSDDRLLLLVDGIDEWKSPAAANDALGALESFLGQRPEAAAVLSSRPYGVERLTFSLPWSRADIADLDDRQQRAMSSQYLAPPEAPDLNLEGDDKPAVEDVAAVWDRAHVTPFLDELAGVPELAVLARKPLFLALLATSWHGEPLPPKRFALYDEIVDLMVRRHPAMRRRFSIMVDLPLDEREFKTLMEAVAYALVSAGSTYAVPVLEMQQLLMQALCDGDVLGYPAAESHRMAKAALRMAEDEFGLLVPQGADHVGFVHRVLLDHLAGRRLARMAQAEQERVFKERLTDPAWLDVLLAALTAQSNPHTVADLLDRMSVPTEGTYWPLKEFQAESATELVAHALASEVELPPRKAAAYIDELVREVETSPTVEHRVNVVAALVRACANPSVRRRLLPTFIRWLDATRPYPAPAVYALRDLDVPDDSAAAVLLHAMRVESGDVRGNAALAYAGRFGSPRRDQDTNAAVLPEVREDADPKHLDPLLRSVLEGPTVKAQATAILALVTGWPDEESTREHLKWGRRQSRVTLRITSMYLLMKNEPDTRVSSLLRKDEIDWILGHIYEERWISEHEWFEMTTDLVLRLTAEAPVEYRTDLADFVLETLKTNGATGGNRSLCWRLACEPLADDDRLRDWVRGELSSPDEHRLVLYNVALVPSKWSKNPAFAQALAGYADRQIKGISGEAQVVAQHLPEEQRKAVLLKGLTGFRPQGVAWTLMQEFSDDEEVGEALRKILADEDKAGNIASVAVSVLGTEAGFIRILGLLKNTLTPNRKVDSEQQVLLAKAVATAWRHMRNAVAANEAGKEPEEKLLGTADSTPAERLVQARRVLVEHAEVDVCGACTAVDSYLGWHVADIIYTWPKLTVDYAIAALLNNRHVTEGIADTIHSAALRAHVEQPGADSARVVDLAMRLMLFLDPEVREVLAHELCISSIPGDDLLNIFSSWKNDPDDGVRRTIAVGLTQALIREQASRALVTPEMEKWRASVRQDLGGYGPHMDSNRRDAWLSMLLLNDLTLIDGLRETIGDPEEPGVDLADIYGSPDSLLVTLVADRWEELKVHFGDSLLQRLSGSRLKPSEQDRGALRAVKALATSAGRNPAIGDLVDEHLAAQTESGSESLNLSIPVIQEKKRRLRADRSSLELVVRSADENCDNHDLFDRVTKWALTELLDAEQWQVTTADVREVLAAGVVGQPWPTRRNVRARSTVPPPDSQSASEPSVWDSDRAWQDSRFVFRRSVWALLYPQDVLTQKWLTGLESWFADGVNPAGAPASWLEISALSFGASPTEVLPSIVERVFQPMRLEMMGDSLWELTAPLLHRVRHDRAAAESLRASLGVEAVNEDSPLFAKDSRNALWPREPGEDTQVKSLESNAQRTFVSALALQRSGQLERADLEACLGALRRVDPRTVVVDPFLNIAGPVWPAGISLLRGQ
ncbi:NACHT domain-containing protein [Arthrobacter sp. MDT1-48-3]